MYYVYIATNKNNTVLYTGVTNNLERRIFEHKSKEDKSSFASKYNINKLVYFQEFLNIEDAIFAEKKIKGWKRAKKIDLINSINPNWKNLFEE